MAEHVAQTIKGKHHIETVVIGAVALASHNYVRYTQDIDLGTTADFQTLRAIKDTLEFSGYRVSLREANHEDPLGGVLDIRGECGLIQIVSFADKFPAVISDALSASTVSVRQSSPLKVVPIPHLVVLKLYAGGLKSKADIVELLLRNPEANLGEIEALCQKYRIKGFSEIQAELNGNEP
ncbi:hypothetical protein P0Y35_10210 [Kiritimatiellaeota bacterium B1221]|nr:hypothetical protein [Kiritimatiellaeota bacterium B1221]